MEAYCKPVHSTIPPPSTLKICYSIDTEPWQTDNLSREVSIEAFGRRSGADTAQQGDIHVSDTWTLEVAEQNYPFSPRKQLPH